MNPLEVNLKLLAERLLPALLKGESLTKRGAEAPGAKGESQGKAPPEASLKGEPLATPQEVSLGSAKGLRGELGGILLDIYRRLKSRKVKAEAEEHTSRPYPARLLRATKASPPSVEGFHTLKADSSPKRSPICLELPFFFPGDHRKLQLLIWPEEREGRRGEEQALRLLFYLTPKSLGPLRVDALLLPSGLRVGFTSEREEVARFIEGKLPELERGLRESGLKPLSLFAHAGSLLGEGVEKRDLASRGLLDLLA